MNKKVAGISVGVAVVLAGLVVLIWWLVSEYEGFSSEIKKVSFMVVNKGKGPITVQVWGAKNGTEPMRGSNIVRINPGGKNVVGGKTTAKDKIPFTLAVRSSVPNDYNIEIHGAKRRNLGKKLWNLIFVKPGPMNQWDAWQESRLTSVPLPMPITQSDAVLKDENGFVSFISNDQIFNGVANEPGRRLFIERLK